MHIKNIIKACGIHLRKYIAPRDMPYALAAILLGFLNHFLYQLSGRSAFIALGAFEIIIFPDPIRIGGAVSKIPPGGRALLLSPFPCRHLCGGRNDCRVLYLYGNDRTEFPCHGHPDLRVQHLLRIRCRCLFLPQMHKKDLTGSNLLPVDPCLFVLLCIHLFSAGYPALLLGPKIVIAPTAAAHKSNHGYNIV